MAENNEKNKQDVSRGREQASRGDVGLPQGQDQASLPDDSNVTVAAKPGESAGSLIRRFRYRVREVGLMERLEKLRFYEKPSQRKKYEKKLRWQKIAKAKRYSR